MESEKHCERCGEFIASMWSTDWYRYIRLKYCPECRKKVKLDQNNEYRREKKKAGREAHKIIEELIRKELAENERLRVLKAENDQLRKRLENSSNLQ